MNPKKIPPQKKERNAMSVSFIQSSAKKNNWDIGLVGNVKMGCPKKGNHQLGVF